MPSRNVLDSTAFTALAETRWGPKRHWHCAYCGRGIGLTVDHFWPLNDGGTDDVWNSVPCCYDCNRAKSDRAPIAWLVAVGVPEHIIARLLHVVMSGDWVARVPEGERLPRMPQIPRTNLDYAAGRKVPRVADRPVPAAAGPRTEGLPPVFDFQPDEWSPRATLWRVSQGTAAGRARWSTPQALYSELRHRGFREMKRTGTWGFWGVRTVDHFTLSAAPES